HRRLAQDLHSSQFNQIRTCAWMLEKGTMPRSTDGIQPTRQNNFPQTTATTTTMISKDPDWTEKQAPTSSLPANTSQQQQPPILLGCGSSAL
ncbi:unnamed protein product, partial [Polarella glacialis]